MNIQYRFLYLILTMPKLTMNQLAAFTLVMNIFLLPLCFVHQVDFKPPVFRERTLDPSHLRIRALELEEVS
jgi:hypothetical protein